MGGGPCTLLLFLGSGITTSQLQGESFVEDVESETGSPIVCWTLGWEIQGVGRDVARTTWECSQPRATVEWALGVPIQACTWGWGSIVGSAKEDPDGRHLNGDMRGGRASQWEDSPVQKPQEQTEVPMCLGVVLDRGRREWLRS